MPTLFISYKRGTSAVDPLMKRLDAGGYRRWYDREDIHAGENWREAINRGVDNSVALVVCLTPEACASEFVQYEVERAKTGNKLIFPVQLQKIEPDKHLPMIGLPDIQFIDFTGEVFKSWDEAFERLLADMRRHEALRITRHTRRAERNPADATYTLHQNYLKRLIERVGTLNLSAIAPDQPRVDLEAVYIDSPTNLSLTVEVENWTIPRWWVTERSREEKMPLFMRDVTEGDEALTAIRSFKSLADWRFEESALNKLTERVQADIEAYRRQWPNETPTENWNSWRNGLHGDVFTLELQDIVAACDRLVILGKPGSGKSTFVRHLALCLANEALDGATREAGIAHLRGWPHGKLTPVYVELRHFINWRFKDDVATALNTDHLWDYIAEAQLGGDLEKYQADLKGDLDDGYAVIVLDGLDEVPYPPGRLADRQRQLIALAEAIDRRYQQCRVIVASRPHAYEGWTLPGYTATTITDFEDDHRLRLAERLYRVAGQGEDSAKAKAESLNQQLNERRVHPSLRDRPLFLTLMATVYLHGEREGLPTRRGALYRRSIELLLMRWTQEKSGTPALTALLNNASFDDLYRQLAELAYEVHGQFGHKQGEPEIPSALLAGKLMKLGLRGGADVVGLFSYLSENAGVLVSPGQDDEKDVFHFAHRSFQEYLAAAHLAHICTEQEAFGLVGELMEKAAQTWREPCQLVGDVLTDTGRRSDLWLLLGDLLEDDPPQSGDDPRWWRAWLASEILIQQEMLGGEKLRRSERAVCDQLRDWTVALIETPQALEPVERAACGRALGLVGDPRPGVSLDERGLPDIYKTWCDVPAGEFIYQDGEKVTLKTPFKIAKYPVTMAQFDAFLAMNPQKDDALWKDMPDEDADWDGTKYNIREFRETGDNCANHPRTYVSWYQSIAFCRWLTKVYHDAGVLDKTHVIWLAHEKQWERAARGTDGREYPYEGRFDATKGNTDETGIGMTSAVGIFPGGVSPTETLDMSGNVWEWCASKYEAPDDILPDSSSAARVVRGGSFDVNSLVLRVPPTASAIFPLVATSASACGCCASPLLY